MDLFALFVLLLFSRLLLGRGALKKLLIYLFPKRKPEETKGKNSAAYIRAFQHLFGAHEKPVLMKTKMRGKRHINEHRTHVPYVPTLRARSKLQISFQASPNDECKQATSRISFHFVILHEKKTEKFSSLAHLKPKPFGGIGKKFITFQCCHRSINSPCMCVCVFV